MFTRCPECHTAFRVTAGQLQQAAGRVRCGHCGAAFDALRNLSEAHPSGQFPIVSSYSYHAAASADRTPEDPSAIEVAEDEQESEEIVLETGSHDLDDLTREDAPTRDDLPALAENTQAATAREDDDYVPEIEDTGIEWVVLDDETGSHWAQGTWSSEAVAQRDGSDERVTENLDDTLSREASALLGDDPSLSSGSFWTEASTPDAPDPLSDTATHLWQASVEPKDWRTDEDVSAKDDNSDDVPMLLPADPGLEDTPESGEIAEPEVALAREDGPDVTEDIDLPEDINLAEEFNLWEDIDLSQEVSLWEGIDLSEDIAACTGATVPEDQTAEDPEQLPPSEPDRAPAPTPAPAPGAKQSMPHELASRPPSIDALEGAEQAVPSRRWLSVALALVLLAGVGAQSIHHFRDSLAIGPRTGPAVGWLYETLGRPLYPAWPLEDYQLLAQDDALMATDRQLQIRATLSNTGARALPSPLIRLTLLDRWGESMGSRIFQPAEYLPAQAPSRLLPGAQLDATLSVRAPPGELYGYRLDVCHRMDAGNVRCDAQSR